jgi:hypothetical protein
MSYQGKILGKQTKEFIDEIFEFLKKAMMNVQDDAPFRGPKIFVEGDFIYTFKFVGSYSYFKGREIIKFKGKKVFFQDIMGEVII